MPFHMSGGGQEEETGMDNDDADPQVEIYRNWRLHRWCYRGGGAYQMQTPWDSDAPAAMVITLVGNKCSGKAQSEGGFKLK